MWSLWAPIIILVKPLKNWNKHFRIYVQSEQNWELSDLQLLDVVNLHSSIAV